MLALSHSEQIDTKVNSFTSSPHDRRMATASVRVAGGARRRCPTPRIYTIAPLLMQSVGRMHEKGTEMQTHIEDRASSRVALRETDAFAETVRRARAEFVEMPGLS